MKYTKDRDRIMLMKKASVEGIGGRSCKADEAAEAGDSPKISQRRRSYLLLTPAILIGAIHWAG